MPAGRHAQERGRQQFRAEKEAGWRGGGFGCVRASRRAGQAATASASQTRPTRRPSLVRLARWAQARSNSGSRSLSLSASRFVRGRPGSVPLPRGPWHGVLALAGRLRCRTRTRAPPDGSLTRYVHALTHCPRRPHSPFSCRGPAGHQSCSFYLHTEDY